MQPADFEALLRRLNMNNAEFARHWQVATSTVRRLLIGTRRITPRNRQQICETAVEILIGRRLGPQQTRLSATDSTPEDRDVARSLPSKGRRTKRARPPAGLYPSNLTERAAPDPLQTLAMTAKSALSKPAAANPTGCQYREFNGPSCGDRVMPGSAYCAWHRTRAAVETARTIR